MGGGRGDDERLQNKRGGVSLPVEKCRSAGWALESFDDCLACPSALTSAIGLLLSERYYSELCGLVRRSAFVLLGREEATMLGFRALREGRHALFLVAILPILEHGLRCLFSCANDSPEHFFAQLRQYYTTLDGVSQKRVRVLFLFLVIGLHREFFHFSASVCPLSGVGWGFITRDLRNVLGARASDNPYAHSTHPFNA